MIVFGGEAFGRSLGHESRALMNEINPLIKGASPLLMLKDAAKTRLSMDQKVSPHQIPNLLVA